MAAETQERPGDQTAPEPAAAALADTGSRRPPAPSPGRVLLTVCALLALCGAALFLFTPDPAPDRRPRRVEPPAFLDPPPPARVPVPVPPPAAPQPEEVKDADA